MQTHLHYVEYPDINIQIKYPNKMVNADAPYRCVCINQLIRIFYLNINIRIFHVVNFVNSLCRISGYWYPDKLSKWYGECRRTLCVLRTPDLTWNSVNPFSNCSFSLVNISISFSRICSSRSLERRSTPAQAFLWISFRNRWDGNVCVFVCVFVFVCVCGREGLEEMDR